MKTCLDFTGDPFWVESETNLAKLASLRQKVRIFFHA